MFVFKAAVVGAGTMGGEIAQAIAVSDIDVVLKDIKQEFVDHGIEHAREVTKGQLDRLVKKEKLTQEQADARLDEVMGRIHGTLDYSDFGDVDFVIEAAPEKMEIKQAVFRELDEVTPGHAILASNTSSLSITEMGDATLRPDKVVGFHFFYPASVMPLLEIVRGEDTSEETVATAINFAQTIKKQPITCEEVPGFVVNRILNSAVGEIWRAQEEGGLSIKKIDESVAAANVAPMGPFILVDLLGLDTVMHVAEHLQESYGDSFYVHEGMQKLVADGKLGAKTGGSGFYENGEPQIPGDGDPTRGPGRPVDAEGARRGLPGARGGRLHGPRDRPRHDGRRRPRPPPRPLPAVLEGRHRRPRRDPREARERRGEARRALRAAASPSSASSPRAASASSRARASTPTRRPTRASRPTRSSWRPAATSRSPGSPTRR